MTNTQLSSPPPENDKAVSVPADTKSGVGVCTSKPIGQSNLDVTKGQIVRKGCKVQFHGGLNGYVVKVNRGQCWAKGMVSGLSFFLPCSEVRVVN